MTNKTLITIPERIEFMKRSKAYSPEDAARKVISIAETMMNDFLTQEGAELIKASCYPQKYSDYCAGLKALVEEGLRREGKSPYETEFGNSVSDTVVSLAFLIGSIFGRFKDEKRVPHIFYDLKMTLGDYLDALIDISVREDGTADAKRAEKYRGLKEELSQCCDLSKPLCLALGDILEQYTKPLAELGRTSHIICCDAQVRYIDQMQAMREEFLENESNYYYDDEEDEGDSYSQEEFGVCRRVEVEEEGIDEIPKTPENTSFVSFVIDDEPEEIYDGAYAEEIYRIRAEEYMIEMDPLGYYLSAARDELTGWKFNFESVESWTDALLLSNEDHSPEAFKAKADKAELFPGFRELVDELVTEESVSNVFKEINAAVSRLYRLLAEPFADLEKYHFERRLADGG